MATGGLRQKRALNTVEVFDPKKPKVSSVCGFLEVIEIITLGWLEEAEQVEDARRSVRALCSHPQRS